MDTYPLRQKGNSHLRPVFDPSRRLASLEFERLVAGLPRLVEAGETDFSTGQTSEVFETSDVLPNWPVEMLCSHCPR